MHLLLSNFMKTFFQIFTSSQHFIFSLDCKQYFGFCLFVWGLIPFFIEMTKEDWENIKMVDRRAFSSSFFHFWSNWFLLFCSHFLLFFELFLHCKVDVHFTHYLLFSFLYSLTACAWFIWLYLHFILISYTCILDI